jgi:hypothetical protein
MKIKVFVCFLCISLAIVLIYENREKVGHNAKERAMSICGSKCQDPQWPTRIILERADGVVVLALPYARGESLMVINTKNETTTDESATSPYIFVGGSIITTGIRQNMNELRVLRANSDKFELVVSSKLPATLTYDNGSLRESNVAWTATNTDKTLIIAVFREPTASSTSTKLEQERSASFDF